jgi:hypothetical protein
VGYQHSEGTAEITYGLALAHETRPSLELLGECHGSGKSDLTAQGLLCGVGFRWKLQQTISLLGAVAVGVAGSAEDRPDHRVYGGVQLRW